MDSEPKFFIWTVAKDQQEETTYGHDYCTPLCSCTTIIRGEALLMTLLLGAERSLTWKATRAILSMINTLFGDEVVPASKIKLFKLLNLNENIVTYHLFCEGCSNYFGAQNKLDKKNKVCDVCKDNNNPPEISYFLTFDVSSQLKNILEHADVRKFLLQRFANDVENNSEKNYICNMSDGRLYQNLSAVNRTICKYCSK
ncbi:uncharacterized protein LOC123265030 [Cotesia glomerata]|uniref:uncharacterized protein LOC123265030 n=1 Tax=Cotesia glomerata TaxID=32391 RepID=UPI001D009FCF|nr:uncharacterized protein LOC123265030 [Cotesia glomerata]